MTATAGLEIARNFRPEIILCDIGLPGMDGYQIAHTIRQDEALSSTCVIALTGYGREKDRRQSLKAGFDLHLTKPIDYNNLRSALARIEESHLAKQEKVLYDR
jgi:CheY-like chemotaxis protein